MRYVAFVPKGDVLETDNRIGTNGAGHAADTLREYRVTFVRHRRRAFLPGLEFLLRLANLGALPMSHLQSDLLQCRGNYRQRAEIFGVAVTLDDLCGDVGGLKAK